MSTKICVVCCPSIDFTSAITTVKLFENNVDSLKGTARDKTTNVSLTMQIFPSAIFVVFVTLRLALNAKCAKILVLHPLHGGSHKLQMQVLSKHLIGHGHQVTTLSFQNVGDVVELEAANITNYVLTEAQVDNSDGRYPYMTVESQGRFRFPVELLWKSGHNPHYLPLNAFKMTEALCRSLLGNEQLLATFRQHKFDLAIVDVISNECGLAFAYQAGISSTIAYWALFPVNGEMDHIGSFLPPSFVPTFLSQLSDRMSFTERLYNTYLRLGGSLVMELQFHLTHKYIQEYFPKTPHPQELIANLSGVLINSDFSLDYPKLLPPNAVNVGCMQCRDPLPLPKDLQDFMESSGEFGVVIFSMGASFDAAVAKNLVPKLFHAFSRLQQNVLVKVGSQPFFNVPSNVKLVHWFPQQDVLGHPKSRVFFTHCGLHGVLEAIWHAVPILGMPIFGDQFDVLARIQERQIGVGIGKDASAEDIYQALNSLLNTTKFNHKMTKLQKLLQDQRDHPMERAIWHIEYVLRNHGARHWKLASRHLNWFQLYCLDVVLTFVVLAMLIGWMVYRLVNVMGILLSKLSSSSVKFQRLIFLDILINTKGQEEEGGGGCGNSHIQTNVKKED